MSESWEGKYTRSKDTPIEIQASRGDSYEQFINVLQQNWISNQLKGMKLLCLKWMEPGYLMNLLLWIRKKNHGQLVTTYGCSRSLNTAWKLVLVMWAVAPKKMLLLTSAKNRYFIVDTWDICLLVVCLICAREHFKRLLECCINLLCESYLKSYK